MKIYIAGKISGLVYENALAEFARVEEMLTQLGYEPVNPMTKNGLDGDGKEYPWIEYMRRDIPLLIACDAIYLLPNWSDSRGAKLEHEIAVGLGLKVIESNMKTEIY